MSMSYLTLLLPDSLDLNSRSFLLRFRRLSLSFILHSSAVPQGSVVGLILFTMYTIANLITLNPLKTEFTLIGL